MIDTQPSEARQRAYAAVYRTIRQIPGTAHDNGRVWQAVQAALDAYENPTATTNPGFFPDDVHAEIRRALAAAHDPLDDNLTGEE